MAIHVHHHPGTIVTVEDVEVDRGSEDVRDGHGLDHIHVLGDTGRDQGRDRRRGSVKRRRRRRGRNEACHQLKRRI